MIVPGWKMTLGPVFGGCWSTWCGSPVVSAVWWRADHPTSDTGVGGSAGGEAVLPAGSFGLVDRGRAGLFDGLGALRSKGCDADGRGFGSEVERVGYSSRRADGGRPSPTADLTLLLSLVSIGNRLDPSDVDCDGEGDDELVVTDADEAEDEGE